MMSPDLVERVTTPSGRTVSDAQRHALIILGGRVWGRDATPADFATLYDKPIDQLSLTEAGHLIDRLRTLLRHNNGQPIEPAAIEPAPAKLTRDQWQDIKSRSRLLWGEDWRNALRPHAVAICSREWREWTFEDADRLLDKLRHFEWEQEELQLAFAESERYGDD